MKDLHVSELFKEHCNRCIKEDKGKNYNYLQETYAKTELFDLSLLDYGYDTIDNVKAEKGNAEWIVQADFLKDITLPFESIFVKLPKVESLSAPSLYVHEFTPTTITGCAIFTFPTASINYVFHIFVDKGEVHIPIEKEFSRLGDKGEIMLKEALMKYVMSTLYFVTKSLNSLPKHTVVADKTNKQEYYRRKGLPTIKVYKPIYYVMDKKETENSKTFKLIKPLGKLEYTYSFKVRSHWRRIDPKSYGKNRNGEYVVKGYTFVKDYIKGEGELVKRVRVLK